jgi:hypothetical protein
MKSLFPVMLLVLLPSYAGAQQFDLQLPASATDATMPAVLRDLAERVLPVYQESNRERYLANLSALQVISGGIAAADATRQELREWRHSSHGTWPADRSVVYDIYIHARAIEASDHVAFAQALTQAFQNVVPQLGDPEAYQVTWSFEAPPPVSLESLQRLVDGMRPMGSVALPQAVDLIWSYFAFNAYRSLRPLVDPLVAADQARRYTTEQHLRDRGAAQERRRQAARPARIHHLRLPAELRDGVRRARLCRRRRLRARKEERRGPYRAIRARWRGCARGDRLDRQAALERRPRGHVRR